MKEETLNQLFKPENGIETAIVGDAAFIEGCEYGKSRSGHPEGKVKFHVKEVLDNIDKFYGDDEDRRDLRLIALVHDTFKHKVDRNKPKTGDNHHGNIAKVFTENYISGRGLLYIIEKHDEAYNAWGKGARHGDWYKAETRANKLIRELVIEGTLDLYLKFYKCDNRTGDKEQDNYDWFCNLIN